MSGALTRASSASWSVSLLLALPLGLHAPQVVVDLVLEPRRVPAGRPRHQLCGGTRCVHAPVEGLDGDPGAPGEHVVEVPRSSCVTA